MITKEQERTLPRWLQHFDGYAEDGNTPLSRKDWEAMRRQYVGAAEPVKQARLTMNIVTEALFETWLIWQAEACQELPRGALRDRGVALGMAIQAKADAMQVANKAKRARMASVRGARKSPAGRPRIKLRVTDPNGNDTIVYGYDAASALTGYSPNTIKVRMTYAKRETGYERTTLGRANRADQMWLVTKLYDSYGTEHATQQDACQKDENDEEDETG